LFGPKDIIGKMTEVLSHIGAWAPKPEQQHWTNTSEKIMKIINFTLTMLKDYEFITLKFVISLKS
jgi:hypothetical protein